MNIANYSTKGRKKKLKNAPYEMYNNANHLHRPPVMPLPAPLESSPTAPALPSLTLVTSIH
jgi:hypothetical protein